MHSRWCGHQRCRTPKIEAHGRLLAADEFGQGFARSGGVGPAQGAVTGVDPQPSHRALAHDRDVGGRGRAEAAPERWVAAIALQPVWFWASTNVCTIPKTRKPTKRLMAPSMMSLVDTLSSFITADHRQ